MVGDRWATALRSRHGVRCGVATLLTLVIVVIAVFSGFGSARADAAANSAQQLPPAGCAVVDPGALHGVCYRLPSGGLTFLGSYRDSATGLVFICLDYGLSSAMGPHAFVSPSASTPLFNQSGMAIVDALTRVLGFMISKYAPAGSSGDDVTDAALALITREVMRDGYFGTAITSTSQSSVMDTSYGVGASVLARAQAIWTDARTHLGAYTAAITGIPTTVAVGQTFAAKVTVRSAAGLPMSGYQVRVTSATSNLRVTSGPWSTDARGQVIVTAAVTGRLPSPARLSVQAEGLPGAYPQIAVPPTGSLHGSALSQRGLVATESISRASVTAAVVPRAATPTLTTQVSTRATTVGHAISDTITVLDSHGVTVSGSFRLSGPVAPVNRSCARARWSKAGVAAHGTFSARGNPHGGSFARGVGRYIPTRPGCYSYTERLQPSALTAAVGWSQVGARSETVLVRRVVVDPDNDGDNDVIDPDERPSLHSIHRHIHTYVLVPHVHTTYRYVPRTKRVTHRVRVTSKCAGGFAGLFCSITSWIRTIVKTVVTWIRRAVSTITYTRKIIRTAPLRCYYVLIHPCHNTTNRGRLHALIYQRPPPRRTASNTASTHCVFVYRRGCVLLANPPHARYIGGNGRGYPKVGPNHSLGYEFKLGANWLWGSVVQPSGYAVTHPVSTVKAIVRSTVSDFTHCNIRYLMSSHCGAAAFDIASVLPIFTIGRIARSAKGLRDMRLAGEAARATQPELFPNLAPSDIVRERGFAPVNPAHLSHVTGRFNYVVDRSGQLIIGNRRYGHIDLADGNDVLAAGETRIVNGEVVSINNASGHYRPHGGRAEAAALRAFRSVGLRIAPGAYREIKP